VLIANSVITAHESGRLVLKRVVLQHSLPNGSSRVHVCDWHRYRQKMQQQHHRARRHCWLLERCCL